MPQHRPLALAAVTFAAALGSSGVDASSWLPEAGTLVYGVDYNDTFNIHHYNSHGVESDAGHSRIFSTALTVAYSPADRWQLVASLPWVTAEYHGAFPHPTPVDDGTYHNTVTDLRLETHYQWIDGPFAVAPYVAFVIPTHDYPTMGHAAPGRGLHEAWFGTFIGRSLDRWLPRTYVQARVNYAFVEKVAGVKHDRINVDGEVGYFFNPRWSMSLIANWQDTDGGIPVPTPISNPLFPHHDQLAATRFLNVGAGLAWVVSPRLGTYAVYSTSLHGQNGHKLDRSFSIGLTFGLGGH